MCRPTFASSTVDASTETARLSSHTPSGTLPTTTSLMLWFSNSPRSLAHKHIFNSTLCLAAYARSSIETALRDLYLLFGIMSLSQLSRRRQVVNIFVFVRPCHSSSMNSASLYLSTTGAGRAHSRYPFSFCYTPHNRRVNRIHLFPR
jgi:hypothetical protein